MISSKLYAFIGPFGRKYKKNQMKKKVLHVWIQYLMALLLGRLNFAALISSQNAFLILKLIIKLM